MYKIMIIDDEPIIVQGLSRSIPWEQFGCEVVAVANNGVEGRELIVKHKPDIVFLDICMPEMDGLTMVASLKSEFSNMQVAILTGFRDFEYAQKALTLGVSRFLLKPSNMDELNEAITYMVATLDKKNLYPKDSTWEIGSREIGEKNADQIDASGNLEKVHEHESVASSFIVNNALKYIEENYREKVMLSEVAEKTYVSQWHLSKLLNKHTGQNFSEILNGIRVEKAKELLENPSLRIGDIAEEVGFLDMAHFSRVFKKQVGISANEYRNKIITRM